MNFLNPKLIFIIVTILFIGGYNLCAQNISFTLQKADTLSRSDKNVLVKDMNGDTCSLAIVKTGLKDLKFYTNRSVERIENSEEEYRVWIGGGSSILKIAIPGYPLTEYTLHNTDNHPNLYIFILDVLQDSLSSVIVYSDTLSPVFSLNTNPRNAKLFVNNWLVGKTPTKIPASNSGVKFEYRIVKLGYVPVNGSDSIRIEDYDLTINLSQRSKIKMNFIEFQVGGTYFNSEWWDESWNSYRNNYHMIYGITYGKTGGSGWYTSTKIGFLARTLEGPISKPKFNDLRLSLGLTQSLTKNFQAYGKIGAGYVYSKDSYPKPPTNEPISYNFNGLCIDLGIIFKIGSRILFSAELNPILGHDMNALSGEPDFKFVDSDYSFGLGYAF